MFTLCAYYFGVFMKRTILIVILLFQLLHTQEIPGIPVIVWMQSEYTLVNSEVDIALSWDMWWGENGDHWKLFQNYNPIFQSEIFSNTPQAQHGDVTISLTDSGQYNLIVELCNNEDGNELCSSSSPVTIIVLGDDGPLEIDHGYGISDWGEQFFSPFVDATSWPPFSLSGMSQLTGVKYFNLGFIVARSNDDCQATWGGYYTLDGWTLAGDYMFPLIENNEIGILRELGGDVMVSIGGAANSPLASATDNLEDLKTQYRNIIETYELTYLDFDIEGTWVLDNDATILRAQALTELQSEWENEGREVNIWFTLPVLPDGLTADGYSVVENSVNLGLELAGVNIMAMDYGDSAAPNPEGQMGNYVIQSAESLHSQLSQIYPDKTDDEVWQMIGVTPMIGLNDVISERFTLSDAEQLIEFTENQNIKEVSMWSANRDFECENGFSHIVSIDCSSVFQENYEFSRIFNVITDNPILPPTPFDKNIIGYFVSWGIYARDYHVMDIPAEKINVINYAFANINPSSGTIELGDPYADIDKAYPGDCWDAGCLRGNFHQLQLLKEEFSHIKTLISIGGWTWSVYFSDIAMTAESREIFAQSCVDFILEYDFDGIDLDWEYPVEGGLAGNHNNPDDGIHLVALVQRMRELLDEQTVLTGEEYLLTIASSANPNYMDNLELDDLTQYLDWINVMSYDFHGPWGGDGNPVTNFNSPLFSTGNDPSPEPFNTNFNLDASIQNYIVRGVPSEKLNAGLAFYGRAFGNVENMNNGLYAPYDGATQDGTWENGFYDYWDLEQSYINIGDYSRYWHNEARVPWLYNPETQIMISYDDEESIREKAEYIISENLAGGMFWEFSGDKYDVLIGQVYNTLYEANDGIDDCNPGDLNVDLSINVLDVVIMVNLILSEIMDDCGDMNQDGLLNVLDIVLLVNIIITTEF